MQFSKKKINNSKIEWLCPFDKIIFFGKISFEFVLYKFLHVQLLRDYFDFGKKLEENYWKVLVKYDKTFIIVFHLVNCFVLYL